MRHAAIIVDQPPVAVVPIPNSDRISENNPSSSTLNSNPKIDVKIDIMSLRNKKLMTAQENKPRELVLVPSNIPTVSPYASTDATGCADHLDMPQRRS